jgi:hypothetical protein
VCVCVCVCVCVWYTRVWGQHSKLASYTLAPGPWRTDRRLCNWDANVEQELLESSRSPINKLQMSLGHAVGKTCLSHSATTHVAHVWSTH